MSAHAPMMLTYRGRTQSLSAWSRETGLSLPLISIRFHKGLAPPHMTKHEAP